MSVIRHNVRNDNYGLSSKRKIVVPQQNILPQQMYFPQNMGQMQYIYVLDPMIELDNCASVLIKQQPEYFEAITGCETENRYLVFGQSPEGFKLLFKCKENSSCFMRNCCPSKQREFDMEIDHITPSSINPFAPPTLAPFANAYKPFKCTICCLCRAELFLTSNEGNNLGTVKHVFTLMDPRFDVYDENQQLKYIVTADCCQCGLLCANNFCGKLSEAEFDILEPGNNQIIGKIVKQSATFSEMVTDADSYQIVFPDKSTAKEKLLLLSLGLMIDYQYFETDASSNSGGGGYHRRRYYY